jgi:hypothetical protein
MTVSNGFGQDQTLYTVTIKWKNGFTHSCEQLLNDKQLVSEQDRFKTYRWIESVDFLPLI